MKQLLGSVGVDEEKVTIRTKISATQQLNFAYVIMFISFAYLGLAGVAYLLGGENGKGLFEKAATILPPIITLILGFYFRS